MTNDEAPRLTPREQAPRPSADGAKRVGTSNSPASSGVPERRSTAERTPPSIPPQRTPIRQSPRQQPAQAAHAPAPAPSVRGEEYARPTTGYAHSNQPHTPRRRWGRVVAVVLVVMLAWPVALIVWANSQLTRVEALSGAPGTGGTTYLLVGSDSRSDGVIPDGTEGQRADTIILLNRAPNGQTAMISLPRDTYVDIPGSGTNKLNASYAWGGAPLLVQTVEGLTGLTVDHYVEIGMGGVVALVDAVGGVELCLDRDVNDPLSELVWTAGCHHSDGRTALAFARMRYSDPLGDIGRGERQRQVIKATASAAATPGTLVNPLKQVRIVSAGVRSLAVGEGTGIFSLATLGLAFVRASGESGFSGAPPIASMGHDAGAAGSVVLLSDAAPQFFANLRTGQLTPADFGQ